MKITEDTTWSGTVTLDDDVRVARGVTLTVAAGTEIIGNGHEVEVRGTLTADGTTRGTILFDDVALTGSTAFNGRTGTLTLDHTEFRGGSLLGLREDRVTVHTSATITDSVFVGLDAAIHADFVEPLTIEGNVFLDSPGILLASASPFTLTGNIFEGQVSDGYSSYAFAPYQTYYELSVGSEGNAFLSGNRIAIEADGTKVISTGDYFAGNPESMIWDSSEDGDSVDLIDPKTTIDDAMLEALSRPLYVHDDFTQPSEFIYLITLVGDRAADLTGNNGAGFLTGNKADNVIAGNGGGDILDGRAGDDLLRGGSGDDALFGEEGTDTLLGGKDDDALFGDDGDDRLHGGGGADELFGGAGRDTLIGGSGMDTMTGGRGADTFQFKDLDGDTITDFKDGDLLDLRPSGLGPDDIIIHNYGDDVVINSRASGNLVLTGAAGTVTAADILFA